MVYLINFLCGLIAGSFLSYEIIEDRILYRPGTGKIAKIICNGYVSSETIKDCKKYKYCRVIKQEIIVEENSIGKKYNVEIEYWDY